MSSIDEDDLECRLELACSEFLSAKEYEADVVRLFTKVPGGKWMLLENSSLNSMNEDVSVAWLQLPGKNDPQFRLVVFLHEQSGWSMTAMYDVGRLLRSQTERE